MEGNAAVASLGCCEVSYQNYKERDYMKKTKSFLRISSAHQPLHCHMRFFECVHFIREREVC